MGSIGRKWLAAPLLVVMGAPGCGGEDKNFATTPGSASPNAARTPEDVDAKIPNLAPRTNPRQKRDI